MKISSNISFQIPWIFKADKEQGYSLPLRERVHNCIEKYFSLKNGEIREIYPPQDKNLPFVRPNRIGQCSASVGLTLLKIVSYITLIVPLIMLLAKFLLRLPYSFENAKKPPVTPTPPNPPDPSLCQFPKITPGHLPLNVPSERYPWLYMKMPAFQNADLKPMNPSLLDEGAVNKELRALFADLENGTSPKNADKIELSDQKFVYFHLKQFPGVRFLAVDDALMDPLSKSSNRNTTKPSKAKKLIEERYNEIESIRTVINKDSSIYSHLYLPKHKIFSPVNDRYFLAEEEFPCYSPEDIHLAWKILDENLRPAFAELTSLMNTTELESSVPHSYTPFCEKGVWKLILTKPHITITYKIPQGIQNLANNVYSEESLQTISNYTPIKQRTYLQEQIERRKKELAILLHHERYHGIKGASYTAFPHSSKLIKIDESNVKNLKLNLNEKATLPSGRIVTMKEVCLELIKEWNRKIVARLSVASLFYHRITYHPSYGSLALPKDVGKLHLEETPEKNLEKLWTRQILTALQEGGHICFWNVWLYENRDKWDAPIEVWF